MTISTTKTWKENGSGGYQSTWTYVFGLNNTALTVSSSSFTIARPTVTAKYVYSGKKLGSAGAFFEVYYGSTVLKHLANYFPSGDASPYQSWATGVTKTLGVSTYWGDEGTSISTSSVFNSSNASTRTVTLTYKVPNVDAMSTITIEKGENGLYQDVNRSFNLGTVSVTLNAPPVLTNATIRSSTASGIYWTEDSLGLANSSIVLGGSISAQYGGTIKEATLTVGSLTQTVAGTSISLPIVGIEAGTYTPVLTVTDSRGQTSTKTFDPIEIVQYERATYDITQVQSDTNGFWAGASTASVTVSNINVPEGYVLETARLYFRYDGGSRYVTKTLDGTETSFTISSQALVDGTVAAVGTGQVTPDVYIKDSRGLWEHNYLDPIMLNQYTNTSIGTAALARVNQNGIADDEGAYALITMDVNYVHQLGNLLEPVVTVTDEGSTSSGIVTWYESWNATSGVDVTSEINWANYNPTSPVTLYGLVSGFGTTTGFNTEKAFQISVTARDTQTSSSTITQTLDSAFYTIDFLAGGHGIAFGQPATQDGFECNMPTTFHDAVTMEDAVSVMDANSTLRALFDFIHPVGSYYETSDTSFDPNVTWGGTWEKSTHISEEESLLYTGSFTAGSITLNDDVKNYWRIAVTANDNDGSIKTFNVINNYANFYTYLDFQRITGAWYGKTMIATFNGKTMTANSNREVHFSTVTSDGTYVTVKSIYGYKINTIIGWHRTA